MMRTFINFVWDYTVQLVSPDEGLDREENKVWEILIDNGDPARVNMWSVEEKASLEELLHVRNSLYYKVSSGFVDQAWPTIEIMLTSMFQAYHLDNGKMLSQIPG